MDDQLKTPAQLSAELTQLRERVAELETEQADRKQLATEIQDAREYAENIVETVREPLVVLNSALKILTANHSFYDTFKVSPEETIGHFVYDLGNRQWDIPKLRLLVEEILPHDTVITGYEVEHDFPTIGHKTILLNARQIFRENISSHIILLAMEDITEHRQAEEALIASEIRYRRLFETAKDGILILDADTGRVADVNPFLIEMLGYSHAAFLGKKIWELGLFTDRTASKADFRELQQQDYIRYEDLPLETADGRQIDVEFVSNAYQVNHHKVIQCNIRDTTERKRATDALSDLNATLEQRVADRTAELQIANRRVTVLDHLKDEFLARISHELRTPLAGILISLELLETSKPEKRERYMQRLKQATDRLREMIEDVLMFSQLNLYTQPSALEPIDLNNLIEDRSTTWQNLHAGRELQFQLDLARDLPPARADGELVIQALTRLITNAINYTPAGSVIVSTARIDETDRHWVAVSVQDTGPGITPEDLPNIFERFYRGRAAADYKTPGTGVGLSISREIAQKLGGRLTVETEVGAGSTFTLWLPVWPETAEGRVATEVPSL